MSQPSNFYQKLAIKCTPVPGATGYQGKVEESIFDTPIRTENEQAVFYMVGNLYHCAFAPAISNSRAGTERWFIRDVELTEEEIQTIKSILADIKLAPMYLSDPLYKYTARHVLKLPPIKY